MPSAAPPRRPAKKPRQLLHLVFGGELNSLEAMTFRDLKHLDIVGIYPDYASATAAWKAKAQASVDNAHMRYFVVHLHRLLDPAAQNATGSCRLMRKKIAHSRTVQEALGFVAAGYLRFVHATTHFIRERPDIV